MTEYLDAAELNHKALVGPFEVYPNRDHFLVRLRTTPTEIRHVKLRPYRAAYCFDFKAPYAPPLCLTGPQHSGLPLDQLLALGREVFSKVDWFSENERADPRYVVVYDTPEALFAHAATVAARYEAKILATAQRKRRAVTDARTAVAWIKAEMALVQDAPYSKEFVALLDRLEGRA